MKITCSTCGTPYEVDDSRIPPGGLTMRCTQCHTPIQVQAPGLDGDADSGWDDLPSPVAAAPPPQAAPNRYHLRRRTGKVFGPFLVQAISSMLEQGKLEGDEEISTDGQNWMPMGNVPELAPYAKQPPQGAPAIVPAPPSGVADLPAPKRAVPDLPGFPQPPAAPAGFEAQTPPPAGEIPDLPAPKAEGIADLPAPVAAPKAAIVPPPPSKPIGGGGFDMGDFELAPAGDQPDGLADLPAPKGTPLPGVPQPPPSVPQPPGFQATAGEIADLPAPKQPGLPDLPAPKAPTPEPLAPTGSAGGLEYGQLDLGGDDALENDTPELPAPVPSPVPPPPGFAPTDAPGIAPPPGIADLPMPKQPGVADLPMPKQPGVADLPMPKQPGVADLPMPKQPGIADLPAPKGGLADLPAPKQPGVTDLLAPKDGQEYGQLDLGGDAELPVPAGATGLELDSGFDLPAPKEGPPDFDAPDLVQPKRDPSEEVADLMAPKGDGVADMTFDPAPSVPGETPELTPPVMVPDDEEVIRRPSLFKRRMLMGSLAAGVFLLVVGIALGLLTPFGFFGAKLLSGAYGDSREGQQLVKSARELMKHDTSKSYDQIVLDLERAIKKLPDDDVPVAMALRLEALSSSMVRFGAAPSKRSQSTEILKQLTRFENPPSEVERAQALRALAIGNIAEGTTKLKTASSNEPGDAQAAVYLGWALLAGDKAKEAKAAFARALSAAPRHAAALFGTAQAEHLMGATKPALASIDKTLKASPKHPSALLLKTRILFQSGKRKEAEQTLRKAASPATLALASRRERSQTHNELGELERLKGQVDEARDQYNKALKINPANIDARVGLAHLEFGARKIKDALIQYQQAQTAEPKHLEAGTGAASCFILLGKPLKAQKTLQKLRPHHPKAAVIPFLLGKVEASVKNYQAAETNFKAAIKQKKTYFEPYRELSQVYVRQGKVEEAFALLREANKHLPGSPLIRDAEGAIFLDAKDLKNAKAKFEEAVRLDPGFNRAQFHLGITLLDLGELDEAKARFLSVFKRDGTFPGLAEKLGELYIKFENYTEAAKSYDRALQVDLPSIQTRLDAAKAYNLAEHYDKALKQTELVLKEDPNQTAPARALRADARLGQGKLDDALVEARQAVSRDREARYLVILGEVHFARKEYADAIDAYRDALKAEPKRIDIRFRRAVLMVRGGQVQDGIRQLKKVIKAGHNVAQAQFFMGIALVETGQEKKALAAFRTAIAKDPKLGEAHFRLGQIYFDTRKLGAALGALKRAVKYADDEKDDWRADAYYQLGVVAQMQGQRKLSVESFKKFLGIAPAGSRLKRDAMKRMLQQGWKPPQQDDD